MNEFNINKKIIEESLLRKGNQITRYFDIMDMFFKVDVSNNLEFQKKFNGFYRIRRNKDFCKIYYCLLEKNKKNKDIKFEEVLKYLKEKTNRVEASFTSKLIATINPNMPIWDSIVLKKFNKKVPKYDSKERIGNVIKIYEELKEEYKKILSTKESKELIYIFDKLFNNNKITDIKKIDFILWSIRN